MPFSESGHRHHETKPLANEDAEKIYSELQIAVVEAHNAKEMLNESIAIFLGYDAKRKTDPTYSFADYFRTEALAKQPPLSLALLEILESSEESFKQDTLYNALRKEPLRKIADTVRAAEGRLENVLEETHNTVTADNSKFSQQWEKLQATARRLLDHGVLKMDEAHWQIEQDTGRQQREDVEDLLFGLDDTYELSVRVGTGGLSEVWSAVRIKNESGHEVRQPVAIKILSRMFALNPNPSARTQHLAEADTLAELDNEHFPHVIDFNGAAIVMEHIDGEGLDDLVGTPELTLDRSMHIIKEAATGMAHAHEQGIFHFDLKPENIMLTKNDGVKIIDFGLTKRPNAETKSFQTKASTSFGTPGYMPPEQLSNKPMDGRTDVFALGVTFYRLATNNVPYLLDTDPTITYKIMQTTGAIEPNKHNPKIFKEMNDLILRMINPIREQRPTMTEVVAEIERWEQKSKKTTGKFSFLKRFIK